MTHLTPDIRARYSELVTALQAPDIYADPEKFRALLKEQANLEKIIKLDDELTSVEEDLTEAKALRQDSTDPSLNNFLETELSSLERRQSEIKVKLDQATSPQNPDNEHEAIVEIRAAAGGDEAGLFAGELYRMYLRFAEDRGWKVEELSNSSGGIGNIKEVIFKVLGPSYGLLKYESGVHRVQRVPKTESAGRVHTSTATVAVLPVVEPKDFVLNPDDIEFEAFRSSGAGGQNVNKVSSAVRLRHKPSGLIVTSQSERSQLQNRERAMEVLRAKLYTAQKEAEAAKLSSDRKAQIGSGDRTEKIRTYNFPQDRVTDHRSGISYHNLPVVMDGKLDQILSDLKAYEEKEHPQTPA